MTSPGINEWYIRELMLHDIDDEAVAMSAVAVHHYQQEFSRQKRIITFLILKNHKHVFIMI